MKLAEGDRIVVKFHDGSVMGYFLRYYNHGYAVCTTDDQPDGQNLLVERRRISTVTRSAAAPPSANIQIFEATAPIPPTTEET